MKAEPEVGKPGCLSNRDGQKPCKCIKFVKGVAVTTQPEKKLLNDALPEKRGKPRDRQRTWSTKSVIEGEGINN